MTKYGYIIKENHSEYFVGELKNLVDTNCDDIIIEKGESNKYYSPELKKLVKKLKVSDEIVIPRFSKNYKTRFYQKDFLLTIKKLNIQIIVVLDKNKNEYIDTDKLIEYFYKNKNSHKNMGRPKIPDDKVSEVVNFRINNQLTYREISELTNLSIGTVYKYIREYKKEMESIE